MTVSGDLVRSGARLAIAASHAPGMARDRDAQQGLEFRAGFARARRLIEAYDPELVVLVGPDHLRCFTSVVPAVAVVASATAGGDAGSPPGTYRVPGDLAVACAQALLDAHVDVAVARDVVLDHGFGLAAADLLGGIDARQVLPVFVNCADPPLAPLDRVLTVGRELGRWLDGLDQRVLLVASGGLSHAPPSLVMGDRNATEEHRRYLNVTYAEEAAKRIAPDWDAAFLAALAEPDADALAPFGDQLVERAGVGANEVRTWALVRAAAGHPLDTIAYQAVPEWITGMGVAASRWALAEAPDTAGATDDRAVGTVGRA